MISNQVCEAFRSIFESFLANKGIKWCDGCFAGYKNGLFSYVELIETYVGENKDIDIIYRVLPDFYVDEKTIAGSKNCLFTFRMIANSIGRPVEDGLENFDEFFEYCLDILKSEYDKLFLYESVTDYAQKMIYNCNQLIEFANKNSKFSDIYGEFSSFDFTCLVYCYLKNNGSEQCGTYIMNLISAYKILLYDKMKYGNIAELKEKLSKSEQQKLENMFKNYGKLTRFAEAMLENNLQFFAQTDKIYEIKKLKGREYIQKLLN